MPVDDDDDGYAAVLNPEENVSPDLINTAVDHMIRFGFGLRAEYAFAKSLSGSPFIPLINAAWRLIPDIKYRNDDNSIINALRLSAFDDLRVDEDNQLVVEEINPDKATIDNVEIRFSPRGAICIVASSRSQINRAEVLRDEVLRALQRRALIEVLPVRQTAHDLARSSQYNRGPVLPRLFVAQIFRCVL